MFHCHWSAVCAAAVAVGCGRKPRRRRGRGDHEPATDGSISSLVVLREALSEALLQQIFGGGGGRLVTSGDDG